MAKFYVQSANTKFVVTAADAEGAALWVINQIVERTFPNTVDPEHRINGENFLYVVSTMDQFDAEVLVSEIGFGRCEVAILDTELLFKQWYQLVNAVSHLFDQM